MTNTSKVKKLLIVFLSALLMLSVCFAINSSINKDTPTSIVNAEVVVGDCYSQEDSRWGDWTYNGGDIYTSGCGILSLVNIIDYYNPVDPFTAIDEIAYWAAYNRGAFSKDGTWGGGLYPYVSDKWGSKYNISGTGEEIWSSANDSRLKEHLSVEGNVAVAHVYGHFIGVVRYDPNDSTYLVLNSYQKYSSNVGTPPGGMAWYSVDELSGGRNSKFIIDRFYLFTIGDTGSTPEPSPEPEPEPVERPYQQYTKTTKVLGDIPNWKIWKEYPENTFSYSDSNWDLSALQANNVKGYDGANSKATLYCGTLEEKFANGAQTDNILYFNQSASPNLEVEATFKVRGKVASEEWGKFGISFVNGAGNGIMFYVDANGTNGGTEPTDINGNSVGYAYMRNNAWTSFNDGDMMSNAYNPLEEVTLKVVRNGAIFKLYVNGSLYKTVQASEFVNASEDIYASIRSFNVGLDVTDAKCTAQYNAITVDGDISDWERLPNWNEIEANKKYAADIGIPERKSITTYTRLTSEGFYVYFKANHTRYYAEAGNGWYQNTAFEIMMNLDGNMSDDENDYYSQIYMSPYLVRGFQAFSFNTVEIGPEDYVTVGEGFISRAYLEAYLAVPFDGNVVKYGVCFRSSPTTTDIDWGVSDGIVNAEGNAPTIYWTENGKDLYGNPYEDRVYGGNNAYSLENGTMFTTDPQTEGKALHLKTYGGDDNYYFTEADGTKYSVTATFKTGDKNPDVGVARVGLMVIDYNKDGFFFYTNARGDGTYSLDGINIVYLNDGAFDWSTETTVTAYSGARGEAFTLSLDRNANEYKLYLNGELIRTVNGAEYTLVANQTIYTAIHSGDISYTVTDYGVKHNGDGIEIDGDLSDWERLSNWEEIDARKIEVRDEAGSGKGYAFRYRLTEKGLYVSLQAKHDRRPSDQWSEWWKNLNVEMFINNGHNSSQFYRTELLSQGFTASRFYTTGTTYAYETVFEGYVSTEDLIVNAGYNGTDLTFGVAFKVDSDVEDIHENITINGVETVYWTKDNVSPLYLPYSVTVEEPSSEMPDVGDSSSSSSAGTSSSSSAATTPSSSGVSSSSSSAVTQPSSSSSSSSSSNNPSSSSVSSSSSSVVATTSSQAPASTSSTVTSSQGQSSTSSEQQVPPAIQQGKGCKGSFVSDGALLILALSSIALAIVCFKKKRNN